MGSGRRGLHISGLRTPVAATAKEVDKAVIIGEEGRKALSRPGCQLVYELLLTQRYRLNLMLQILQLSSP